MAELNIAHKDYNEAMKYILSNIEDITHVHCNIYFGVDYSQSKIIRDFVGKIFDAHHIHTRWRGRFILITDELINNAIEHGSAKNDLDVCVIHAEKGDDKRFHISLEVQDTGNGKDSGRVQDIGKIMETHTRHKGVYMGKRGRGLFHITEKLVDSLTFSKSPIGGLAVRIEKTINV
ncbi:MAG: ATP-binding protein [Candidatus Gracilibacteria bacterium]|nr:ATP-binding protein [Candidatus Gracilibacteria bacterium]